MVGLRDQVEQLGPAAVRRHAPEPRHGILVGLAKILPQIHSRAPAVARAGDHDDFRVVVGFQLVRDLFHLDEQRRIHRVAFLRPVESDPGDPFVIGLDQYTRVFFLCNHRWYPFRKY